MSSNALRVVPVVDGLGEGPGSSGSGCTCLCVCEDRIFIGKSNGCVDMYRILAQTQPAMIPTVGFVQSIDLSTKKSVVSIVSSGGHFVCISGDNAYSFDWNDSDSLPALLQKVVSTVAIRETSRGDSEPIRVAVALIRRKIVTFVGSKSSGFQVDGGEISTGSDVLTDSVWFNDWIIAGSSRAYVSVSPFGDRTVRDILDADGCVSISILKSTNEVLLVGQDGLGIFMTVQSDGLTPAPRNTVAIEASDAKISIVGTYLVSVSGEQGRVEVFSLTSNEPKLIQSINLPSSAIASSHSFSASIGVPVVAGSVMYLLITVPFESQLKKLIESGKIQDALELVNYQFSAGPVRNSALKLFHNQVGWKQFNQGDYSIAFIHLTLGLEEGDIDRVLTCLEKESDVRMKIIAASAESVINFLTNVRGTSTSLKKNIDAVLFQVMSESELVLFIENEELGLPFSEARAALLERNYPLALSKLYEKTGDFANAGNVLCEKVPETAKALIDLVCMHFEKFDKSFIVSVIQKLIHQNLDIRPVLGRLDDPVSVLETCTVPVTALAVKRQALEWLADSDGRAREKLVEFLIADRDIESLERFVLKFKLDYRTSCFRQLDERDPSLSLVQMLLLGHEGKHREAFIRFPERGEEFIDRISGVKEGVGGNRIDLLLLFAAVLFDHHEHEKGTDVLLRNKNDFIKSSPSLGSKIVEIIPSDLVLTEPLIEMLKKINRAISSTMRSATIDEIMSSYSFLNTYSEWSNIRQSQPVIVTEENSLCKICNQNVITQNHLSSIAVLPSGAGVAHPTCCLVETQI